MLFSILRTKQRHFCHWVLVLRYTCLRTFLYDVPKIGTTCYNDLNNSQVPGQTALGTMICCICNFFLLPTLVNWSISINIWRDHSAAGHQADSETYLLKIEISWEHQTFEFSHFLEKIS